MARIKDSQRDTVDQLTSEVIQYKTLKDEIDALTEQKNRVRDSLMETIEIVGDLDDKGNQWLELDQPVEGIEKLLRMRKVSQKVNEERALEIVREAGLEETCIKTVEVIDEDGVFAALFDKLLTEDQVENMFDKKVSWALHLK
jgi:hypothetical protein